MAQSSILSPGTRIGGKFEVVEVIGFGGMGVVYKVREQVGAVSRIRALKTVLPQYAADPAVVKRFREEAEKMCMLEHENIVPVLSYSEEGEFPYLIMPFLEGRTLKEYLAAYVAEHGGPLPLSDVLEIGLAIADGLEVAHGFVHPETRRPQPMIHRDIKPGNIMVRVEERGGERRIRVLIMDFGIAKVLSEEDTGHSLTDVIGTVKYASPEQIKRGKDIDPRADIYSLGMVLYELYCGHHMFANLSEHSVLMRMMQREVEEQPPEFPEHTPVSFRELIRRSVAVDRERRFASVGEMRVAMRRALAEDSERLLQEEEKAREAAGRWRKEAMAQRAPELAPRTLGEAESLCARAEQAGSARQHAQAIQLFREAAAAFEQAVQAAARGQEGNRVLAALDELDRRREAAVSSTADRLASREFTAVGRAAEEARRVLSAGEITSSARLLAGVEQAWRDFESAAAHERERRRLAQDLEVLAREINGAAERVEELPVAFRSTAGAERLSAARAAHSAAKTALEGADLGGVALRITEAREALREVATARERAQAEIEQAATDVHAELSRRWNVLKASGRQDFVPTLYAEVRAMIEAAEQAREGRRFAEVLAACERALSALSRLEQAVEKRLADQEAAERERRRLEAEADSRRAEAEAELARVRALGAPATGQPAYEEACREIARAAAKRETGDTAAAVEALTNAVLRLTEVAARVEAAQRAERLDGLRARREELARRLGTAPSDRRLRRRVKAASALLRRVDDALTISDEAAALAALEECVPVVDEVLSPPTVILERTPTSRGLRWGLAAAGVGIVITVAGYAVFRRVPVQVARVPRPSSLPTVPPVVPPSPEAAERVGRLQPPAAMKPTAGLEPSPRVEPTAPMQPTAAAEPVAEVAAARVSPPPGPKTVEPLVLASASPRERVLRLTAGSEQQFETDVRGPKGMDLVWELDRVAVGRGETFTLRKSDAVQPGRHRLELVALRDETRATLTAWQIEVRSRPPAFVALEPRSDNVEAVPGRPLAFRAAVDEEASGEPSFEWQVNGRKADAQGPVYELAAADPGRYRVTVSAKNPWGDRADHTWNVTLKSPPAPSPPPRIQPLDARAEILGWVDAYCRAFERKDTEALVRLGHLRRGEDEQKLRSALAAMENLQLNCTNTEVSVDGDEAVVSFDRTDRWNDPNGSRLERKLPRITKRLRRDEGHWTASR